MRTPSTGCSHGGLRGFGPRDRWRLYLHRPQSCLMNGFSRTFLGAQIRCYRLTMQRANEISPARLQRIGMVRCRRGLDAGAPADASFAAIPTALLNWQAILPMAAPATQRAYLAQASEIGYAGNLRCSRRRRVELPKDDPGDCCLDDVCRSGVGDRLRRHTLPQRRGSDWSRLSRKFLPRASMRSSSSIMVRPIRTAATALAAGARVITEQKPGYGRACAAGVAAVRD